MFESCLSRGLRKRNVWVHNTVLLKPLCFIHLLKQISPDYGFCSMQPFQQPKPHQKPSAPRLGEFRKEAQQIIARGRLLLEIP